MPLTLPRYLPAGSIHLVLLRLSGAQPLVGRVSQYLSAEEIARAERFIHVEDRHRHILGRGVTRLVVGGIMGIEPEEVRFQVEPQGKPVVRGGPSFNISHSGDFVALAFAASGRLGVDVEYRKPLRDLMSLARATFRPDEVAELRGLPDDARQDAFFRIWTRKEAMLKALGCGLSELDSLAVSGRAEGDALREISLPGESLERWTLRSLELDAEHALAFAWDGQVREVVVRGDQLEGGRG